MPLFDRALRIGEGKKFKQFEKHVARINDFEPELELESDDELRERYERLRERATSGEPLEDLMFESFAVTREAAKRTLGQRHFDVQLIGGMVLHDGSIAEMKTGEGKTLTSTLPICLNALASRDADGNAIHSEWTGKFNGRFYPVTGDPASDSRSYRRINKRTMALTGKKDGKVNLTGRIIATANGRTRTVTATGTNSKGKKVSNRAVYDKE